MSFVEWAKKNLPDTGARHDNVYSQTETGARINPWVSYSFENTRVGGPSLEERPRADIFDDEYEYDSEVGYDEYYSDEYEEVEPVGPEPSESYTSSERQGRVSSTSEREQSGYYTSYLPTARYTGTVFYDRTTTSETEESRARTQRIFDLYGRVREFPSDSWD